MRGRWMNDLLSFLLAVFHAMHATDYHGLEPEDSTTLHLRVLGYAWNIDQQRA